MKIAAARSLAGARPPRRAARGQPRLRGEGSSFGPDYIIPKPFDPRVLYWVAPAVAKAADAGARWRGSSRSTRRHTASGCGGCSGSCVGGDPALHQAGQQPADCGSCSPRATTRGVLSALLDPARRGVARPILLGRPREIHAVVAEHRDRHRPRPPRDRGPAARRRSATSTSSATTASGGARASTCKEGAPAHALAQPLRHDDGHRAAGPRHRRRASTPTIPRWSAGAADLGAPCPGVRTHRGHVPGAPPPAAACSCSPTPPSRLDVDAEDAGRHRRDGGRCRQHVRRDAPRIAMLSMSSFGAVRHPEAAKVARATELRRKRRPELEVEGEMQVNVALDYALGAGDVPVLRGSPAPPTCSCSPTSTPATSPTSSCASSATSAWWGRCCSAWRDPVTVPRSGDCDVDNDRAGHDGADGGAGAGAGAAEGGAVGTGRRVAGPA